jgi:hypothetical protein
MPPASGALHGYVVNIGGGPNAGRQRHLYLFAMSEVSNQIRCREHGLAPWGFVCVHLVTGASRKWMPAPGQSGPGSEHDWLCPTCAAKPEPTDHSVKLLCAHCIQAMRQRLDAKAAEASPPPECSSDITPADARGGTSSPTLGAKLDSLNQRVQALLARQHTSAR